MSLRQKGIEILFADFFQKYLKDLSVCTFSKDLSFQEIFQSVPKGRIYEKALEFISQINREKGLIVNEVGGEDTNKFFEWVRQGLGFNKFYFFSLNASAKQIDLLYSYPERKNSSLLINTAFLEKIKSEKNEDKLVEGIKNFFKIDFPDLVFQSIFIRDQVIGFLLYQIANFEITVDYYKKAIDVVMDFQFSKLATQKNLQIPTAPIKPIKSVSSSNDQKNTLPNIGKEKIYLYQKLVSCLDVLVSGTTAELKQATQMLLNMAHLHQVVITDSKTQVLYGVFDLEYPLTKRIKSEKKFLDDTKKQYGIWVKKKCARKAISKSRKTLFLFFKKPIPVQKKLPNIPFKKYIDTLEVVMIRLYQSFKK